MASEKVGPVATHRRFRWRGQQAGWTMSDWFVTLKQWDEYMQAQGLAVSTRQHYGYYVVRFLADAKVDPVQVAEQHIVTALAAMDGKGGAKRMMLRALKSYYAWCESHGFVERSPARELRVKEKRYSTPKALSEEDLKTLLEAAEKRDHRQALAMRLCYYTGARVESLCAIRPQDLDLNSGVVHLRRAKGDRPYSVPLPAQARAVARELLTTMDPESYTVIGVKPRTFWMWVSKAGKDAGIHASPHMLRHSYATHLLRKGANVRVVQELLNHQSLDMTQRYTMVTDPDKNAATELLDLEI